MKTPRRISIPNHAAPNACDHVRHAGVLGPCPPVEQPHRAAPPPGPADAKDAGAEDDAYARLMSGSPRSSTDAQAERNEKPREGDPGRQQSPIGRSAAHAHDGGAGVGWRRPMTRDEVRADLGRELASVERELRDDFAAIVREIRGDGAAQQQGLRAEVSREYEGLRRELWDTWQEFREAWRQGQWFFRLW